MILEVIKYEMSFTLFCNDLAKMYLTCFPSWVMVLCYFISTITTTLFPMDVSLLESHLFFDLLPSFSIYYTEVWYLGPHNKKVFDILEYPRDFTFVYIQYHSM